VSWYAQQYDRDRRTVLVQIASIVAANAPLVEGLRVCAEDAPNSLVRRTLRDLGEQIDSGSSLGEAMSVSGGFFKPAWTGLVLSSERTGGLSPALAAIIDQLNVDIEVADLSRNRITYFAALVIVQSAIMAFIVVRIAPVFVELLGEFELDLPAPMKILDWIHSTIALNYAAFIWAAILTGAGVFLGPFLYRLSGFVQFLWSHLVLPVPVVGGYYRAQVLELLAGMMRIQCAGGVPLPDALREASRGHVPQPFGRALRKTAETVESGERLSAALARRRYLFGERFIEFVRCGEGREDLASSFGQAEDLYRRRALRRRRALADALIPVGVAFCGSGVLLAGLALHTMLVAIADGIVGQY